MIETATPKLLFDEPPVVFQPSLAVLLGGVNKAIVVQQLHYWLRQSQHWHEGRPWVWNTYKDWHEQFPFIGVRTFERILPEMVREGLIVTANFNKAGFDKTKWYTLNYDALDRLRIPVDDTAKMAGRSRQTGDMGTANSARSNPPKKRDPSRQNGDTNTKDFSKTTTKTSTEIETPTPTSAHAPEDGEQIWIDCLNDLELKLSKPSFQTWFVAKRTLGLVFESNTLVVACEDQQQLEWIESRYAELVKAVVVSKQGYEAGVKLVHRPEIFKPSEGGGEQ